MSSRLIATFLMLVLASEADAASRYRDIDDWFARELVPGVANQLETLPRFRNQSLRFVVMREDSPQSEGSALAVALRDRLRDAIADIPGMRVAWQGDRPGTGLLAESGALDCTRDDVDYFIGLEITETRPGDVEISVRALDVEERTWVTGFKHTWRGALTAGQRRQFRHITSDPTFKGERHAPWRDSETDLMAAQLAYELGCKLLGQTAGEYVIAAKHIDGDVDATTALVELVTNNLAGVRALQFGIDNSNAAIEGKAHRINEDLYQYWISIRPIDGSTDMTALSASAYVVIPDEYQAATLVPEAMFEMPRVENGFLTSFRVVRTGPTACAPARPLIAGVSRPGASRNADCFSLQVQARNDAVVFFLNHQLNHGLVRLADDDCSDRSLARVARMNELIRQPLPANALQSGSWFPADSWSLNPHADTYVILAATDTDAARQLSKHVEALPKRCSSSVRPGFTGNELRQWLAELDAIVNRWAPEIDWRSIRVRDVY